MKNKFLKHILPVLLALIISLQMLSAFAISLDENIYSNNSIASVFSAGTGTYHNPYIITTSKQLIYLATMVNSGNNINGTCYALGNDIVLNDISKSITDQFDTSKYNKWNPIGNSSNPFYGDFFGNGHTIYGMVIDSSADYQGLFGYTNHGRIWDVHIRNAYISGGNNIGSIVGYMKTTGDGVYYCSSNAVVSGNNSVGGISGYTVGYLLECYYFGKVEAKGSYGGGICGYLDFGTIDNSYNIGNVTANRYAGGICGYNDLSKIRWSYNAGYITAVRDFGPIIGSGSSYSFSYCYYDESKLLKNSDKTGTALSYDDSKLSKSYIGFDFDSVWTISEKINDGYPYLVNNCPYRIKNEVVYTIFVVDTLGRAIKNANVVCNGVSKQTKSDGSATFEHRADRKYSVTVKQIGYQTYSRSAGDTSLDQFTLYSWETNSEVVILQSTSETKIGVSNVYYQNNGMGLSVDIQHRQKVITKPTTGTLVNLDDGLFDIVCKAKYAGYIKRYELWQGNNVSGKKIATSTTGNFTSLSAVNFNSDVSVTLYTYDANGHFQSTPLYLVIKEAETAGYDKSSLSLGKKTTFEIPADIPYVGGTALTMDTLDLPVDVIISDDTIHVGLNTNFKVKKKSGESFTPVEKDTFKSQIQDIKNTLSDLNKLDNISIDNKTVDKNISIDNKTVDKVKKILKIQDGKTLPGTTEAGVYFVGYGEAAVGTSKNVSVTLDLCAIGKFEYNKTWQAFVSVVPIVVSVGASGEVKLSVAGAYDFGTGELSGNASLYPSVTLSAATGVGVGNLIGAQAYGSATLSSEIILLSTKESSGIKTVDLTGELGVKAYLGMFEYSKKFAQQTWHLYSRNLTKTSIANKAMKSLKAPMYSNESYHLSDVSYLDNQSAWLAGATKQRMLLKSSYIDVAQFKNMITGTYRNAQPKSISNGEDSVMVFLSGDTQRDEYNLPRLMYSVYDSESNTWAEPLPVDSNNTSDQSPYLYSDGNDIFLVYCDSERIFTSSDEIEDYICAQSIAVSKFNTETKQFDAPTVIENSDGKYNHSPEISLINGIPTVVWHSNEATDIFGQNNTNSIVYSELKNNEWSKAKTVVSGIHAIVGHSVGEMQKQSYVAYIADSDNDLTTVDDRELYLADFDGNVKKIDEGEISNPVFSAVPGVSGTVLAYYNDGTLSYTADADKSIDLQNEIPYFTDNFIVLSDRIAYVVPEKDCANIYNIIFDQNSNTWSDPVKITSEDKYIGDVNAFKVNNKLVYTMTKKDVTITEESVIDECDLGWMVFNDYSDITIDSVSYEQDDIADSEIIPINIDLSNNGTNAVQSVSVMIKDDSDREIINTVVDCDLKSGETESITVHIPFSEAESLKNLTVLALPVNDDDINETDNTYQFKIGYTELSVTAEKTYYGNKKYAEIAVTNNSISASGGDLKVYCGEQLVVSETVADLVYGETVYYKVALDDSALNKMVSVYLTSNVEDYYDYNNSCELYFGDLFGKIANTIKINSTDLYMKHNETVQLTADVSADEGVSTEYFWYSTDESVVYVSESGMITALSPGTAEVYATTVSGGICDSITITVQKCSVNHIDLDGDGICDNCGFLSTSPEIFTLSLSNGQVVQDDNGYYRIDWNLDIGINQSSTYLNEDVNVLNYGIFCAAGEQTVNDIQNGIPTQSKYIQNVFRENGGMPLDKIYKRTRYSLTKVAENKARFAVCYITYEIDGEVFTQFTSVDGTTTILGGIVSGTGQTKTENDDLDD